MKQIVFGTTNPAKLERIINILKPIGFNVIGLDKFGQLPDVEEDKKTVLENAIKKATHYGRLVNKKVLAMDTSLIFDNVPKEDQPNIFVRRVKSSHHHLTDKEMITHYSQLFTKYGGKVIGHWETAWALADKKGLIKHVITISPPRYFISKPSPKIINGLPIDSLQIDPENGKYFSEMSPTERDTVWGNIVNQSLQKLLSHQ